VKPAFTRLADMAEPMIPRPMTPAARAGVGVGIALFNAGRLDVLLAFFAIVDSRLVAVEAIVHQLAAPQLK
jgi:hypothetical protein